MTEEAVVTIKTQWDVGLAREGLAGVFPTVGKWANKTHISMRCGLQALRLNFLIKQAVSPKLKEAMKDDPNCLPQIWRDEAQEAPLWWRWWRRCSTNKGQGKGKGGSGGGDARRGATFLVLGLARPRLRLGFGRRLRLAVAFRVPLMPHSGSD